MSSTALLLTLAALVFAGPASATTLVQMRTDLGDIDIALFEEIAPLTVQNFLNYMNKGAAGGYDGTYIHRSVPGFVVQGGGRVFDPADGDFIEGGISEIPLDAPVVNEAGLPGAFSNARGSMAMAKTPGDPDSATSEWFFNRANNNNPADPDNLDDQNGGFTVFGVVTAGGGMSVVDEINTLPICYTLILPVLCDLIVPASGFTPFIDLDPANPVQPENLVKLSSVSTAIAGDSDGDGVSDAIEDGAPLGDGNGDGTPDRVQAHVASLPGARGDYLTIAITSVNGNPVLDAPPPARLDSVFILDAAFPLATAATSSLAGYNFAHGFTGFNVLGATALDTVTTATVSIFLPAGQLPDRYFKFGRTTATADPRWYDFADDGVTGADFSGMGNTILLYLVDGERGDSNVGIQDGVIRDPSAGAIAFHIDSGGGGGGGGGCSLRQPGAGAQQAGDWLLLLLLMAALRLHALRCGIRA